MTWRRKWQSTPIILPGEFHEQKSLMGYSPWSQKESDTTESLTHTHTHIHTHTHNILRWFEVYKKKELIE